MIVEHDTRPCTPFGHSAYRGYDATVGKLQSLERTTGLAHQCVACGRAFGSRQALIEHALVKHSRSRW